MLDWIVEGLRWIIWGIISAGLTLMDVCYSLVKSIASVDFLQTTEVWQWYYVFLAFLGILIFFRTIAVYLKFCFEEEFREKVTGSHFIHKFTSIALTVALLPFILGFVSQLSVWSISNMNLFLGSNSSDTPSTFIITSFMNTDNGEYDANGNWISGDKITYTLEDIDINAEGEGDEDYKFFNDVEDLFILTFIGIAAAIILILNGVLIAKRSISIVIKVMIAFIPISSQIVPGDETFSMWRKMIVSDYVLNFFQTLMIMVVMILSGSKIVQDAGVWVQIIMFIGGLLLLLSGIPELSKILGGDTSQAGILQQVASFRMATRGLGGSISRGFGKTASAAGKIAGMGGYGFGRLAGGKSIADAAQLASNNANGFMGGSNVHEDQNTGYSGNTNTNNNDLGTHSILNESGQANTRTSQNTTGYNTSEQNTSPNSFASGPISSSNDSTRLSREGTNARAFANYAQRTNGFPGVAARFASNASKHMYQKSMSQMQTSKLYKATKYTNGLRQKGDLNNVIQRPKKF